VFVERGSGRAGIGDGAADAGPGADDCVGILENDSRDACDACDEKSDV